MEKKSLRDVYTFYCRQLAQNMNYNDFMVYIVNLLEISYPPLLKPNDTGVNHAFTRRKPLKQRSPLNCPLTIENIHFILTLLSLKMKIIFNKQRRSGQKGILKTQGVFSFIQLIFFSHYKIFQIVLHYRISLESQQIENLHKLLFQSKYILFRGLLGDEFTDSFIVEILMSGNDYIDEDTKETTGKIPLSEPSKKSTLTKTESWYGDPEYFDSDTFDYHEIMIRKIHFWKDELRRNNTKRTVIDEKDKKTIFQILANELNDLIGFLQNENQIDMFRIDVMGFLYYGTFDKTDDRFKLTYKIFLEHLLGVTSNAEKYIKKGPLLPSFVATGGYFEANQCDYKIKIFEFFVKMDETNKSTKTWYDDFTKKQNYQLYFHQYQTLFKEMKDLEEKRVALDAEDKATQDQVDTNKAQINMLNDICRRRLLDFQHNLKSFDTNFGALKEEFINVIDSRDDLSHRNINDYLYAIINDVRGLKDAKNTFETNKADIRAVLNDILKPIPEIESYLADDVNILKIDDYLETTFQEIKVALDLVLEHKDILLLIHLLSKYNVGFDENGNQVDHYFEEDRLDDLTATFDKEQTDLEGFIAQYETNRRLFYESADKTDEFYQVLISEFNHQQKSFFENCIHLIRQFVNKNALNVKSLTSPIYADYNDFKRQMLQNYEDATAAAAEAAKTGTFAGRMIVSLTRSLTRSSATVAKRTWKADYDIYAKIGYGAYKVNKTITDAGVFKDDVLDANKFENDINVDSTHASNCFNFLNSIFHLYCHIYNSMYIQANVWRIRNIRTPFDIIVDPTTIAAVSGPPTKSASRKLEAIEGLQTQYRNQFLMSYENLFHPIGTQFYNYANSFVEDEYLLLQMYLFSAYNLHHNCEQHIGGDEVLDNLMDKLKADMETNSYTSLDEIPDLDTTYISKAGFEKSFDDNVVTYQDDKLTTSRTFFLYRLGNIFCQYSQEYLKNEMEKMIIEFLKTLSEWYYDLRRTNKDFDSETDRSMKRYNRTKNSPNPQFPKPIQAFLKDSVPVPTKEWLKGIADFLHQGFEEFQYDNPNDEKQNKLQMETAITNVEDLMTRQQKFLENIDKQLESNEKEAENFEKIHKEISEGIKKYATTY
jgi:hypothetical protein